MFQGFGILAFWAFGSWGFGCYDKFWGYRVRALGLGLCCFRACGFGAWGFGALRGLWPREFRALVCQGFCEFGLKVQGLALGASLVISLHLHG